MERTYLAELMLEDRSRVQVVTREVSVTGAQVLTPVALDINGTVDVHLGFPPHGDFQARARVMYCRPLTRRLGGYELGLAFTLLDDPQKQTLGTILARLRVEAQEIADNRRWSQEILAFAETQPSHVAYALYQILLNADRLSRHLVHSAHDELLATWAKVERSRAQPDGAIERERLDSPLGNFGEAVAGKLYRGGQPSPEGLRWLKATGVKAVVILREPGVEETNYQGYSRADYKRDIKKLRLKCIEMPMPDRTTPTAAQIHEFVAMVDQPENQPVYVHCAAGVGRTGILVGAYLKHHGTSVQDILDASRRFLMNPDRKADHALQASFIATFPIGPPQSAAGPTWSDDRPHPVQQALQRGRGFVMMRPRLEATRAMDEMDAAARDNIGYTLAATELVVDDACYVVVGSPPGVTPRSVKPSELHPARLIKRALETGVFLCVEFGRPGVLETMASMARVLPNSQKMAWAALAELNHAESPSPELLTLVEVDRVRELMGGDVFVVASCRGLVDLTLHRALELADKVRGHAQVIDFALPEGRNPSPETVRTLWEQWGLACVVSLGQREHQAYWDALGLPYLGVTSLSAL
ncbi:MAG TPA: PilZ domain-containing protein, partial [Candidatus Xenobia bacterium]